MTAASIAADWRLAARFAGVFSGGSIRPAQAGNARRAVASWRSLRLSARFYVAGVVVLGGLAIVRSVPEISGRDAPFVAALTILSLITSGAKVRLPLARSTSTMTICYVIDFATLLLFGPAAATLTAAAGAWSQCVLRRQYRTPAYQTWFSVGTLALTVQAAGLSYSRLGGLPGLRGAAFPVEALVAAGIVFFLANSLLVAGAVALSTGQSTLRVWTAHYLWSWPGHLIGFSLAVGAAFGIGESGYWLLPFALVSLALTYENFKAYVARFTDSVTDPLTGLSNVRHLLSHIGQELARSHREASPLAVILLDLDGFKSINDTYGHRAGDLALRQVAQSLRRVTRSYDMCARYGGDEFVVVLPGCSLELARRKAQTLKRAVAALKCEPKGGVMVPLRISVGVALFPVDGDTFEPLLAAADARMFEDKAGNGSRPSTTPRPAEGENSAMTLPKVAERQLQDQLLHAQKLAAIGQLTGGVAHDFNNVLTAILGYSELLTEQIGSDNPIGRDLKEIVDAAQHGAALTHQLLAFSRNQRPSMTPINLNEVVDATQTLLRRLLGERVVIVTRLPTELHSVIADRTEIEQVLINLSVNARDAMPQGGELRIETHNVDLDSAYAAAHPGARAGAYVALSITDTGVGMTPDVRSKIFDAFFTTKPVGVGTGLGLTTVYGIVTRLDGYISVESVPDRGTTFRIYLPKADGAAAAPPLPVRESQTLVLVGSETILVVEDEDGVRDFTTNALRRHGYQVLEARSSESAVALLEQYGGPVHLLVTDVVLPRMDGCALAARVRRSRPQTSVLFTTGYSDRRPDPEQSSTACTAWLEKPFTGRALLTEVRALLDQRTELRFP